jgi:hypothetical protein
MLGAAVGARGAPVVLWAGTCSASSPWLPGPARAEKEGSRVAGKEPQA